MKEYIIHCHTEEEWDAVQRKLYMMGYQWSDLIAYLPRPFSMPLNILANKNGSLAWNENRKIPKCDIERGAVIASASEFLEEEINISNTKPMSMINKIKSALLSEPEKSLRKAGIFNEDGQLTSDGRDFYLEWAIKNDKDFCDMIQKQVKEEEK